MASCAQCGADEWSRDHTRIHRDWERAFLRRLERDPKEPDGPGTFTDYVRRWLKFDDDTDAGRLSGAEWHRVESALRAEGLKWDVRFRHAMN